MPSVSRDEPAPAGTIDPAARLIDRDTRLTSGTIKGPVFDRDESGVRVGEPEDGGRGSWEGDWRRKGRAEEERERRVSRDWAATGWRGGGGTNEMGTGRALEGARGGERRAWYEEGGEEDVPDLSALQGEEREEALRAMLAGGEGRGEGGGGVGEGGGEGRSFDAEVARCVRAVERSVWRHGMTSKHKMAERLSRRGFGEEVIEVRGGGWDRRKTSLAGDILLGSHK